MRKIIQVIVDDSLLKRIDRNCGSHNRSAFFRQAAELLLRQYKIKQLEHDDIEGYKRYPVRLGEFDVWYSEQAWPKYI